MGGGVGANWVAFWGEKGGQRVSLGKAGGGGGGGVAVLGETGEG